MKKQFLYYLALLLAITINRSFAQTTGDTIVLRDLQWDVKSPAGFNELTIPCGGSKLQGFILTANGAQKHPTLLLLHGFPGNERNLDLAQVVRSHGWNVIYFDYRGSWGSEGKFTFQHCVEDVVNVVAWCKQNADKFKIDTANIALFGLMAFLVINIISNFLDIIGAY